MNRIAALSLSAVLLLSACGDKILSKEELPKLRETQIRAETCEYVCGTTWEFRCHTEYDIEYYSPSKGKLRSRTTSREECGPELVNKYCNGSRRAQWDIRYYKVLYDRGESLEGESVIERTEEKSYIESCH